MWTFIKLNLKKKAVQSNANRPHADSTGYILNRFEHVWGGLYGDVQVEQVLTCLGLGLEGAPVCAHSYLDRRDTETPSCEEND